MIHGACVFIELVAVLIRVVICTYCKSVYYPYTCTNVIYIHINAGSKRGSSWGHERSEEESQRRTLSERRCSASVCDLYHRGLIQLYEKWWLLPLKLHNI